MRISWHHRYRGDSSVTHFRASERGSRARAGVAYDHEHPERLKESSSDEIATITGFEGRAAMVHQDDLVLGRG